MAAEAKAPAVLANVREESGERVDWAPPYRVFDRGGVKVAVVGLVTQSTPSITHSDTKEVVFTDPSKTFLTMPKGDIAITKFEAEVGCFSS